MTRPAVVTGAGQGVGAAVARAFARTGAPVVLTDLNVDTVEEVAGQIRSDGGSAVAVEADVTDETGVEAVARTCLEQFGPVAAWVNNAGITAPAMLKDMSVSDFRSVLDVHVVGTFLGMRTAAQQMIDHGTAGSVINVTSAAGLQGTIGQLNYSAAKGAIAAMTKSGARELARHGVRVNAVAPLAATPMTTTIRTNEKLRERYLSQIPLRRFGEPDEVSSAFTYLASPEAAYVTGQVLCIDGGLYMAG